MNIHRVVPVTMGHRIASALAGAALVGALIIQLSHSFAAAPDHSRIAGERVPHTTHSAIDRREFHELRARSDMQAFAIRNAVVFDSEEAFRAIPEWRALWSLYHLDVRAGDEVVRIYQAVSRTNPNRRFTAMWDSSAGRATDWQLVLP